MCTLGKSNKYENKNCFSISPSKRIVLLKVFTDGSKKFATEKQRNFMYLVKDQDIFGIFRVHLQCKLTA